MGRTWILPALCLAACTTPDPGTTRIIGHAGMGVEHALAPNSRASLLAALALGIDGVELDVQFTADSVLVAFHDERLESSTNCSGLVNALTWAELQACTRTGNPDVVIARLDSLLLEAAGLHPTADFTLDCKLFAHGDWWGYLEAYTDALVALEAKSKLSGRLLVECQVDPFLLLVKRKMPHVPLYRYDVRPDTAMHHALLSGFAGITVHHANISRAQVERAQELGLRVSLFGTSGRVGHWLALRKVPDRLQTDAPELLAPKLNKDH